MKVMTNMCAICSAAIFGGKSLRASNGKTEGASTSLGFLWKKKRIEMVVGKYIGITEKKIVSN